MSAAVYVSPPYGVDISCILMSNAVAPLKQLVASLRGINEFKAGRLRRRNALFYYVIHGNTGMALDAEELGAIRVQAIDIRKVTRLCGRAEE